MQHFACNTANNCCKFFMTIGAIAVVGNRTGISVFETLEVHSRTWCLFRLSWLDHLWVVLLIISWLFLILENVISHFPIKSDNFANKKNGQSLTIRTLRPYPFRTQTGFGCAYLLRSFVGHSWSITRCHALSGFTSGGAAETNSDRDLNWPDYGF